MGIRVDRAALLHQLEEKQCMERAQLPFQKAVIAEELPYSIGGGIGQSRLCNVLSQIKLTLAKSSSFHTAGFLCMRNVSGREFFYCKPV